MPQHPSKEELSGFILGTLPPTSTDQIAEHIEQCPPCQETVHELDAHKDTLMKLLAEPSPPPVDGDCRKVIQQVEAIAANEASRVTDATAAPKPVQPSIVGPPSGPVPSREQFINALLVSKAVDDDRWAALLKIPAVAQAADGNALARALVEAGALTKFQATLLYQNKPKGLLFGEYVVLDKIGAGGMGQVFKAKHRRMDRVVALKVLAKQAVGSPEAVRRFEREVKAAARLSHPNIVTAFDAGEAQGVHFLVMEFVDGRDLSGILKAEGPLPVEKAIDYLFQAARGLEFAHSEGVVHRDIKPANLLLDKKGVVKILDMGLARFDDAMSGGAGVQEGLTQSGQVMGTVDYMAPEQAVDTRTADAKADVYALGCTLYRLLIGENVYGGETLVQKLLAHREQPIPSLRTKRPEVPAALDELFARMMAKRPEERIGSMREVIEALERVRKTMTQADDSSSAPFQDSKLTSFLTTEHKAATGGRGPAVKPQAKGAGRKPPTRKLVAAAAAGAFLLIALGVWIIVRDKDGNEVAKVQVPPGGDVTVKTTDATSATDLKSQISKLQLPPPPDDYALEFDGLNNYVELPNTVPDLRQSHTIEAWVRIDEIPRRGQRGTVLCGDGFQLCVADPGNSDFGRWSIVYVSKQQEGGWSTVSDEPCRLGVWTHLACTIDGVSRQFFQDGRPQGQGKRSFAPPEPAGILPLLLGRRLVQGKYDNPFHGAIAEIRVSRTARYDKSFTPQPRFKHDADTLALYHFDEGTGDVLVDSSGNGHDGKIIGAKWVRADGGALITTGNLPAAKSADSTVVATGTPIDLFQHIVPAQGSPVGGNPAWSWETENGKTLFAKTNDKTVAIPINYATPAAYVLEAAVMPTASTTQKDWPLELMIGLRLGQQRFAMAIDRRFDEGFHTPWTGIMDIAGKSPLENETGKRARLIVKRDSPRMVRIKVLPDLISLEIDGKQFGAYRGPMEQLSYTITPSSLGDVDVSQHDLWIATAQGTQFTSLTLTPLTTASPSLDIPSPGDYALDFSGGNSFVSLPSWDDAAAAPRTIEAWINLNEEAKPVEQTLFGSSLGNFQLFVRETGALHTRVMDAATNLQVGVMTSSDVKRNRLLHVAVVLQRSEVQLYLDGKLEKAAPWSGEMGRKQEVWRLGARDNAQNGFTGKIDEVRISKVARYTKDFTPQARFDSDADTLALYHFDEGTGDVLRDSSGNGRDGKIVGAKWVRADGGAITPTTVIATASAPSSGDYALDFSAGDSFVTLPVLDGHTTPARTIEAWVHLNEQAAARDQTMFGSVDGAITLLLRRDTHFLQVRVRDATTKKETSLITGTRVLKNRLVHIAVVLQAAEIQIYLDGKFLKGTAWSGEMGGNKLDWRLGSAYFGPVAHSPFTGTIDEVRISKSARYDIDFTSPTRHEPDADTLALYHFDEGAGDVLRDSSGNGRDGTIVGAKWVRADGAAIDSLPAATLGRYALDFDCSAAMELPIEIDDATPRTLEATVVVQQPTFDGFLKFVRWGGLSLGTSAKAEGIWGSHQLNGNSHVVGGMPITVGRAFRLALVFDGRQTAFYVDGRKIRDFLITSPPQPAVVKSALLSTAAPNGPYHFYLDEVRFSRGARYVDDYSPTTELKPDADTLALYHFDEGTGDVLRDSSGNNRHGKIIGAKWVRAEGSAISQPSPGDYALDFDGRSAYVKTPWKYQGDSPLTLEAWTVVRDGGPLMSDAESSGFRLETVNRVWKFLIGTADRKYLQVSGGFPVAYGRRLHIAAIFEPTKEIRLYVDGKRRQPRALGTFGASSLPFLIGADPQNANRSPTNFYNGTIDEVRISRIARYDQDFTPTKRFEPDADTLALYHFDEGTGDVLVDSSGNNHHGTIVAAKWVRADGAVISEPRTSVSGAAPGVPGNSSAEPATAIGESVLEFDGDDHVDVISLKGERRPPFCLEAWATPQRSPTGKSTGKVFDFAFPGKTDYFSVSVIQPEELPEQGYWRVAGTSLERIAQSGPGSVAWDRPVHVAASFGPKVCRFFVGGKLIQELPTTGDVLFGPDASLRFGLGFHGTFARVRLSSAARYEKDFTPPAQLEADADTLGLYRFNEGSGAAVYDHSGRGHNGRIVRGKWIRADGAANIGPVRSDNLAGPSGTGSAPNGKAPPPAVAPFDGTHPTTPAPWQPTPEQQAFFDSVAKLSADAQVAAVAKKMIEVNPGFHGKLNPTTEGGKVVGLSLTSSEIAELWPLRALAQLSSLTCNGDSQVKGKLADLSPLAGMPLTSLVCIRNVVNDLSPLTGMQLTEFDCTYTSVTDLSPLAGMPLTKLSCLHAPVQDLSPLAGMPLVDLVCGFSRVSDLTPLAGMPLNTADFRNTNVTDLSPLTQCKNLTALNLIGNKLLAAAQVEELKKALPNCVVNRFGSPPLGLNGPIAPASSPAPPLAVAPFDAAQARAHQFAWSQHLGVPNEYVNPIGMKFVLIPPGEFLLGSSDAEIEAALAEAHLQNVKEDVLESIDKGERPQQPMKVGPFLMGTTEVTVGQFKQFVAAENYAVEGPTTPSGQSSKQTWRELPDDTPVSLVTWRDAEVFCDWLNKQESNEAKYRLPTETEWEYACRAGTITAYSFGDDPNQFERYGWCHGNLPQAQPVGKLKPNPFGLYDMHGNVREICGDPIPYRWLEHRPGQIAPDASNSSNRIIRGGAWKLKPSEGRSARRGIVAELSAFDTIGFRVVCEISNTAPAATAPTK